jgi:predicted nucleotidyltransferase
MTVPSVRLDRLRTLLQGTPGLVSAYLFGSAAEGRMHRESDVDVGVLLDRHVYPGAADRFDLRLRLVGPLEAAAGRPVDLVVLNDAPPHLGRRIMTEGTPLVVADPAQDLAYQRVVRSRAADLEPFLRRARAIKLQSLAR